MPSEIVTPLPAAGIDRLSLATESVRGTESPLSIMGRLCGSEFCFADEVD